MIKKDLKDYIDNTTEIISVDFVNKKVTGRKIVTSNYIDLLNTNHICPTCDLPMILGRDESEFGTWRITICLPCSAIRPLYMEKMKNERT